MHTYTSMHFDKKKAMGVLHSLFSVNHILLAFVSASNMCGANCRFSGDNVVDTTSTSTISFYGVWLQIMMHARNAILSSHFSTSVMRIRGGLINTEAYRL